VRSPTTIERGEGLSRADILATAIGVAKEGDDKNQGYNDSQCDKQVVDGKDELGLATRNVGCQRHLGFYPGVTLVENS